MTSDTIRQEGNGKLPSGRFVLRLEPGLHLTLRETAREERISLNDLCVRRLALPDPRLPPEARGAVEQAFAVLGRALLGVVAFGSWARQELSAHSDLDLLLVPQKGAGIDRFLYRCWDEYPVAWEGRAMEPNFAHLPAPGARTTGFWAEVALDGLVLFDRDLTVSRSLARLRRRIASGEITRRQVHGHTYLGGGRLTGGTRIRPETTFTGRLCGSTPWTSSSALRAGRTRSGKLRRSWSSPFRPCFG